MKKYIVGFSSEINGNLLLKIKKRIKNKHLIFKKINIKNKNKLILKNLKNLDIFITKYYNLPDNFFKNKNKLKLLQLTTSDYSFLDINKLKKNSTLVANNGGANAVSVAEHTFLLILAVYRNFLEQVIVKKKKWKNLKYKNREIQNKKIGIIGMGNVGREIAIRCLAFGMNISYYDIVRLDRNLEKKKKLKFTKVEKIFEESDIISLNLSLNDKSKKLINVNLLSKMKKGSLIINTSRGIILKESIITKVLNQKKQIYAAIDVFDKEPLQINSPLRYLKNIIMTPHCGPSIETIDKLAKNIAYNINTLLGNRTKIDIIGKL